MNLRGGVEVHTPDMRNEIGWLIGVVIVAFGIAGANRMFYQPDTPEMMVSGNLPTESHVVRKDVLIDYRFMQYDLAFHPYWTSLPFTYKI
jgi:hypothetical protein